MDTLRRQKINTLRILIMKKQVDPNILIDIAVSTISDKEPTTLAGRILRWIKRLNNLRNGIGLKIKINKLK